MSVRETFAQSPAADESRPLPPGEALRKFKLADGLAIDQVLSEPLVTQPLHISFDSRGRLWLVEARQYPKPAGLKEVAKDKVWRAVYDKVPPPPPHAEGSPFRGIDRISIHTDADGDGVFESHQVFLDGLSMATSIAHTEHGVWVTHAPYLLFYPDKNRDDIPDGPPEVHLSGFGLEDTHSIANSLRWGPDGWLYGAQGSTVSAAVLTPGGKGTAPTAAQWPETENDLRKRDAEAVKTMGQNIWRYHPPTRRYEIFAEGGGNAYGVEIDSRGRIYSGHNGGDTRGFHYVQGGYFQKGWEKHGELSNPYAFGYYRPMAHAAVERFTHQFIVYESDTLAPQWRGKLWGCDVLHNNIVCSQLIPQGATFRTEDLSRPVASDDKWFRPVMITDGPDGCLYIADWCDNQVNHFRNQEGHMDKARGRVWRVRPADTARPVPALPAPGVAGKLPDNRWLRETWLRLAREDRRMVPSFGALHDFWGAVARQAMEPGDGLTSGDPGVQLWAVRLLGDRGEVTAAQLQSLLSLGRTSRDAELRCQLAATARRLPVESALSLLAALLEHSAADAADPLIPLMEWWVLESACTRSPDAAAAFLCHADRARLWREPVVQQVILERLMKRFAITGKREDFLRCAALLRAAPDDDCRRLLLKGLPDAMKGRSFAGLPDELLEQLAKTGGHLSLALRLRRGAAAASGGASTPDYQAALAETLSILTDGKHPESNPASREALTSVFADLQEPAAVPALLGSLTEPALRRAALSALQRQSDPHIAAHLLQEMGRWPAADKEAALAVLASREPWALTLVRSDTALPLALVKRLQLFPDRELAALIDAKYGTGLKAAGGAKDQEIQRIKALLAAEEGIPKKGETLFQQRCAGCHTLWNKGGKAGPDLTSYQRTDLDMLLLAVVAPSAEIREGYTTTVVETADGSVLAGFLTDQDRDVLVLRDAAGQTHTVNRSRISKETPLPASLMPEGLLEGLTDQEVRDLFGWIRSTTPPF